MGDLDQREAEVVMKDEDGSLIEREPSEQALQLVAVGDRGDVVDGVGPVDWDDANGGRPPPVARRIRVAGVDEDPVGPGLEAVGLPQVRQLPPDGHEGVLQRVLREARIAQDPPGDTEQRITGLVHQVGECFLIARASPLDTAKYGIHRSSICTSP